jgi:anti-sigma regulatory factor (Ser/Thr protein kinase)
MRTSRSFPAVPESTRAARRFVLQAAGDVPPALHDAIAVMVAELAMNAVQHARTEFEVTIDRAGATMRVEVTDSGGGRPAAQPMPPPQSLRGRGLPIVDGLADAWGVIPSPHGPGKSIWFQVSIPPGTPENTVASADADPAAESSALRSQDQSATPHVARNTERAGYLSAEGERPKDLGALGGSWRGPGGSQTGSPGEPRRLLRACRVARRRAARAATSTSSSSSQSCNSAHCAMALSLSRGAGD